MYYRHIEKITIFSLVMIVVIAFAAKMTAVSDTGKSALDGKSLVLKRCAVCHSLTRVKRAQSRFSRKKWEQTVDRMIRKGVRLDDNERIAVIEYLSGES